MRNSIGSGETSEETEGIHGQVTLEDGLTDGGNKVQHSDLVARTTAGRRCFLSSDEVTLGDAPGLVSRGDEILSV